MLISISRDTARQVKEVSGRDSIILPYGEAVQSLPSTSHRNLIPRILFTGRLIQRKGVEYLLRAVPEILAKRRR